MSLPELHTERLRLRRLEAGDVEACHKMYSDPEVTAFLDWTSPPLEEFRVLFERRVERRKSYPYGLGVWGAFDRETERLAGVFMLLPLEEGPDVEIGYHLDRWAWGRGLATEGAAAVLRHGRETLGLRGIVALIRPGNEKSVAVALRLGLRADGETELDGLRCLRFRA